MKLFVLRLFFAAFSLVIGAAFVDTARAQSSDQNFPTAITSSQLNGVIKARDIGDARLTTYFYEFAGMQGDIFINVVSKNLTGDIDVFTVDGLRPLAKMVLYGDAEPSETGRLVYLRKPERLLLRIEGRSPNDDPATFRIKFGGSFLALAPRKASEAPKIADSDTDETGVRVNSVGTIIEVLPKPQPVKKTEVSKTPSSMTESPKTDAKTDANKDKTTEAEVTQQKTDETENASKKPVVVAEDYLKPSEPAEKTTTAKKTTAPKRNTTTRSTSPPKTVFGSKKTPVKKVTPEEPPKEPAPDPMANIHLVIELKDGNIIERPMNEVLRFSVNAGTLVVAGKDGTVKRYSMLDVAKVTIQ